MEKLFLDANVLVRFLRDDHAQHSAKARALIAQAETGHVKLVLLSAVVAEVVFVLTSVYDCTAGEVSAALLPFLHHGGIECSEAAILNDALLRFSSKRVDFMDCYLAAAAKARGIPVASFDRDFRKFGDIELRTPGDSGAPA
jgi:predicted nucleic acid-binding protein